MKKRSLLALVLSFALILSVCTCSFGSIAASAEATIPTFDATKHIDLIADTDLVNNSVIDVQKSVGSNKILSPTFDGGSINVTAVEAGDAETVYGAGSMYYKASAYEPNSAYHYPTVIIADATKDEIDGYLALEFKGKETPVRLNHLDNNGQTASWVLSFDSVTTAQGTTHTFAYSIDTATNNITIWLNGNIVADNFNLASAGVTVNNYAAGASFYYASFELTNYSVFKDIPKIPNYDSGKHYDLTSSLGIAGTEKMPYSYTADGASFNGSSDVNGGDESIVSINDAIDGASVVYSSGSVEYIGSAYYPNAASHFPFVPIANIAYNGSNGYLALIFAGKGTSVALGYVGGSGDSLYYIHLVPFSNYTTDNNTTHTFTYSIDVETNKLSVAIDDNTVLMDYVLDATNNITVNNYTAGFGKFYVTSKLNNYRVYIDKPQAPEKNESTQKEILSFDSTGIKENTKVETYDFSKYVAEDGAVYVSTTIIPEFQFTDWSGPYVALAKTDYKQDANDTRTYYLCVRMSGIHGYFIALYADDLSEVQTIKQYCTYSNGTANIPSEIKLTYKFVDGKVSAWLDGDLILYNHSDADYNLTEAVLGGWSMNTNGYSLTRNSVWIDNADYGYLGDLNGDMQINILDFIRAKKLSINSEGVSAFNDNVKAFNDEGTIGATELTQMRKYLLGIIDSFETASEYGEDTTPAEELL